jgi:hypothetical protein
MAWLTLSYMPNYTDYRWLAIVKGARRNDIPTQKLSVKVTSVGVPDLYTPTIINQQLSVQQRFRDPPGKIGTERALFLKYGVSNVKV